MAGSARIDQVCKGIPYVPGRLRIEPMSPTLAIPIASTLGEISASENPAGQSYDLARCHGVVARLREGLRDLRGHEQDPAADHLERGAAPLLTCRL